MTGDTATDSLFSELTFDDLELPEPLHRAISDLGWKQLTKVQAETLPESLKGRDIVAQAQTGSGKTAAYLLTVFSRILTVPRTTPDGSPRALFVAPTRELAVQIASDAESIGRHADLRIHVVFGGLDYRRQRQILEQGVDLLIGTPGRLIDYHKQGAYSLRDTEMVVIDECDRLFDMGFADDLRWLLRRLPRPADRQSLMFTATLSQRVTTLGWREMDNPLEVIIDPGQLTPDTIHQELYHVSTREKLSLLLGLLKREGEGRTMVFVNTRFEARRLVDDLRRHGFLARGLTGNVVQTKRLKVLDDFREGRLPILVATDVASRGLHIDGVTHVVNYDLPQDAEDYVHRIGRTARVGAEGKAFSLACEDYVYSLDAIQKYVGYDIPVAFAGDELYHEVLPREPRRARDRRSDGGGGRRPSSRDGSRRRDERPRTRDDRPPQTHTAAPESQAVADGGDAPPAPPKRRRRRRRRSGGRPASNPNGSGSSGSDGGSGQS